MYIQLHQCSAAEELFCSLVLFKGNFLSYNRIDFLCSGVVNLSALYNMFFISGNMFNSLPRDVHLCMN